MTQEEKTKRYDEALEIAKKNYVTAQDLCEDSQIGVECFKNTLVSIFPELKEYEDEKIRKELIDFINRVYERQALIITDEEKDNWITWLEKQDEQKTIEEVNGEDYGIDGLWHAQRILEKTLGSVNGYQSDDGILDHKAAITAVKKLYKQEPVDKVEPKFPEGEWITTEDYTWKIISVDSLDYTLQNQCGECVYDTVDYVNKAFHLWTIQDAKDGDVLVDKDNNIGIYKEIEGIYWDSYIYLGCDGELRGFSIGGKHEQTDTHPATKEQRDTLMKAMTDAGYTFDFDKKELKLLISNGGDFESNNSKQKSVEWSEEDEKRRKAILTGLIDCRDAPDLGWSDFGGISIDDCIAWPEKQVGPKFHKGNWVVFNNQPEKGSIYQIKDIHNYEYTLQHILGGSMPVPFSCENMLRLWTISDAKDGDVVCYKDEISLYKHDIKNCTKRETTFGGFVYHCCYDGKRFIMDCLYSLTEQDKMNIHLATKEQRDLLFTKMKEAGYEWDVDKKELRKEEVK